MDLTGRLLVTSAPGLEALLAGELRGLGLDPACEPSGAVSVAASLEAAARVLVRCRVGSRVLFPVRRFAAKTPAMLYDQVRRIDWPSLFPSTLSMAIDARGSMGDAAYARSFAPLKIKDAICDEFRKRGHPRPDVDRARPDVGINAFFQNGRCTLSVDLSGEPLHRRGYRAEGAAAPLRENRAAALLLFAGYDGSRPLVDPFCGSGTIPIEAALIATRRAPGLLRRVEAFTLARIHREGREALEREMAAARAEALPKAPCLILGSDRSPEAVAIARGNAGKAGVRDVVRFEAGDARAVSAPGAFVVTNPPYGERLGDETEAAALLKELTHRLKHHAVGSTLAIVVPRGPLEKSVGLKPSARLAVESAPLALRFLRYEIFAGKREGVRLPSEPPS